MADIIVEEGSKNDEKEDLDKGDEKGRSKHNEDQSIVLPASYVPCNFICDVIDNRTKYRQPTGTIIRDKISEKDPRLVHDDEGMRHSHLNSGSDKAHSQVCDYDPFDIFTVADM